MFYFDDYLKFEGLTTPLSFYKSYKILKCVCYEINNGYIVIFSMFSLIGIKYGCYQKIGNTNINKNNIRVINIMDIDKAKVRLNNGKKFKIRYVIRQREFRTTDIFSISSILFLILFYTIERLKNTDENLMI